MPSLSKLIFVFEETRRLLALPENDFTWSSWENKEAALDEIDGVLSALRSGSLPAESTLEVLFAPTGPVQEVSLSSGWGDDFVRLSALFDEAMSNET
jgi:hypothetical protein